MKRERKKEWKWEKRTKLWEGKYKPHTHCDVSWFDVYSCRVPFDNDQQWSCYLMISNRFVHVKWGKSDILFNKKRERKREMIPTTSTHCENRRTERTRRGRTDAQRLAALRWPRFPFGEFYLIDPPFDLICSEKKNATFWPFFLSFPKSMFLPCFNHCSQCDRFQPGFRHCSRFVPVFLTPRLVSKRPV